MQLYFFFNDTATTEIYTLSLHDALPIFDEPSRERIRGLGLDLIEVTTEEAERFALNLVSDGQTVTMTRGAPRLAAALRSHGLTVVELKTTELQKGGGGIRCTSLTLDNN